MKAEAAKGFPKIGHLLFLIGSYKTEYYYFEVLECVRRLLLASVIGIVSSSSAAAPTIGLLICLAYVYIFVGWRPYEENAHNILNIVLAYSLTLFFLSALMINGNITSNSAQDQRIFGAILICVFLMGPLAIVAILVNDFCPFWRPSAPPREQNEETKDDQDDAEAISMKDGAGKQIKKTVRAAALELTEVESGRHTKDADKAAADMGPSINVHNDPEAAFRLLLESGFTPVQTPAYNAANLKNADHESERASSSSIDFEEAIFHPIQAHNATPSSSSGIFGWSTFFSSDNTNSAFDKRDTAL